MFMLDVMFLRHSIMTSQSKAFRLVRPNAHLLSTMVNLTKTVALEFVIHDIQYNIINNACKRGLQWK